MEIRPNHPSRNPATDFLRPPSAGKESGESAAQNKPGDGVMHRPVAPLSDALAMLGVRPSAENVKMAEILLAHQLPLTTDTMQKLSQALKLISPEQADKAIEKAVFLLKNALPIHAKTVQTLQNLTDGRATLPHMLAGLAAQISAMTTSPAKEALLSLFLSNTPAAAAPEPAAQETAVITRPRVMAALQDSFTFHFANSTREELDGFLNTLQAQIQEAKGLLATHGRASSELFQTLAGIENHLSFVAEANHPLFAQVPVQIAGQNTGAELFVFRDKKKSRKTTDHKASALVALDTLNLGRFEVYVQKDAQQVTCHFRLQNKTIEALVSAHITDLQQALERAGYALSGYTCRRLTEAFTVLNHEPDDQGDASAASPPHAQGQTFFDAKI